jgi:hypothetical protein
MPFRSVGSRPAAEAGAGLPTFASGLRLYKRLAWSPSGRIVKAFTRCSARPEPADVVDG